MSASLFAAGRTLSRGTAGKAAWSRAVAAAPFSSLVSSRNHAIKSSATLPLSPTYPARSFSSSSSSSSSATDDLVRLLQREYKEEVEDDSASMPSELSDLQADVEAAGWKVACHGATTKLIRTLDTDNSKVQISFHAQDSVVDEASFMEQMESGEEVDTDEMAARTRFTVVVTKAGNKNMVFTCLSEDAQAMIEAVAISTNAAMSVDDILKKGSVDEQQYQGPEFGELAEDLQESFHVYLQEHVGINENVASFIAMYADYREQAEYVEFLQEAQNLLK